jgi:hypothetical protein
VPENTNYLKYRRNKMDLGEALHNLAADHAKWSQETFGTDAERSSIGPLKHLEKEATDAKEYADCFLLVLDASRRAGISPLELIKIAHLKLDENKLRGW